MCYRKPGPRCSSHAYSRMESAFNKYNSFLIERGEGLTIDTLPKVSSDRTNAPSFYDIGSAVLVSTLMSGDAEDGLSAAYQTPEEVARHKYLLTMHEYFTSPDGIGILKKASETMPEYESLAEQYSNTRDYKKKLLVLDDLRLGNNPSVEMLKELTEPLVLEAVSLEYNEDKASDEWKHALANHPHLTEKAVTKLALRSDRAMRKEILMSGRTINPDTQRELTEHLPSEQLWMLTKASNLQPCVIDEVIEHAPEKDLCHVASRSLNYHQTQALVSRIESYDNALLVMKNPHVGESQILPMLESERFPQISQKMQLALLCVEREGMNRTGLDKLAGKYGRVVDMKVVDHPEVSRATLERLSASDSVNSSVKAAAEGRLSVLNQKFVRPERFA